jgi:DNA-directed RNA polymerase subunit L
MKKEINTHPAARNESVELRQKREFKISDELQQAIQHLINRMREQGPIKKN